jgi:hypothetical protein
MALFAGRCFHVRFLTDIVSPYALRIAPVIGFEFFVTMP